MGMSKEDWKIYEEGKKMLEKQKQNKEESMEGERLIRELLSVKEKYKNVTLYTGDTNIPMMIDDVIAEINKLVSKNAHDKHYIELGKAIKEAFEIGAEIQDCGTYVIESVEGLLEWAEGRE